VPTFFPLNRYDQQWGLLALLCSDLLGEPRLESAARPHVEELARVLGPRGIGFTDRFIPDGDCTSATVAILHVTGHAVDTSVIKQFQDGNYFYTYPGELQPSLSTTAHAVMALAMVGEDVSQWQDFLVRQQEKDGRWLRDKWHASWFYVHTQVMLSLAGSRHVDALNASVDALLRSQHPEGGWGAGARPTASETSYAVMALHVVQKRGLARDGLQDGLRKAYRWMLREYRPFVSTREEFWIAKTLYSPMRIERSFELAAMLMLARDFEREGAPQFI
jgi:halimadienyl-diphosphate synthase